MLTIKTPQAPAGLLEQLGKLRLEYCTPVTLFHLVWVTGDTFVGVFGDGDNGAYEWFEMVGGKLATSNCGWCSTAFALFAVLKRWEGVL